MVARNSKPKERGPLGAYIVSILLRAELHKPISLMVVCHPVFGKIHVHCTPIPSASASRASKQHICHKLQSRARRYHQPEPRRALLTSQTPLTPPPCSVTTSHTRFKHALNTSFHARVPKKKPENTRRYARSGSRQEIRS